MKRLIVVMLAAMLFSAAAYSEQPVEIPVLPDSKLVTEINLADSDILGMIKQAIPAFARSVEGTPGDVGDLVRELDFNSLSAVIAGVQQIYVRVYDIPKTTDSVKALAFFEERLSVTDGWSRLVYDISKAPTNAGAVFTKSGQDFLAIGVDLSKGRLSVIKTAGFIDVPKLAAWFGNAVKTFAQFEEKKQAEKQNKPVPDSNTHPQPSVKPQSGSASGQPAEKQAE